MFFESSPDACKFVTSDGFFIDINRAAEEMFGYRRDEVAGKTVPDLGLFHPRFLGRRAVAGERLPTGRGLFADRIDRRASLGS